MIFGEVNSFITIFERILGIWKKRQTKPVASVARRFVELFEAHGVHRNQIPRFFGHDILLSDLADDESLLKKLTEPVLDVACSTFAVRREWLDGIGETPYIHNRFYKQPQDFERFIDGLKSANPEGHIFGYLLISNDVTREVPAALILAEVIGAVGEAAIYRYHFCDEWIFRYWKSRAYLTACIAIAWKKEVFINGVIATERDLSTLTGRKLPGPILNSLASSKGRWHPEDLALLPDQYLAGLDPEHHEFGITSALRLWLRLDNEGWMDTGLGKEVRREFEARSAQYDAIEHGS